MNFRRKPADDQPILKSQATRSGCIGPAFDTFLGFVAMCMLAWLMFTLMGSL